MCIDHEMFLSHIFVSLHVTNTGGGAIFVTDQVKMDTVLPKLRNLICLNGVKVFEKLLKVLRSEPIYTELADHMQSLFECITT